jgi:hypothetical protein
MRSVLTAEWLRLRRMYQMNIIQAVYRTNIELYFMCNRLALSECAVRQPFAWLLA